MARETRAPHRYKFLSSCALPAQISQLCVLKLDATARVSHTVAGFSCHRAYLIPLLLASNILLSGFSAERVSPALYRGEDPRTEDLAALKKLKIKTIVSLRTNPQEEKAQFFQRHGINFIHMKIGVIKVPSDVEVRRYIRIVQNKKLQPVYTSCEGNRDRTSFFIAAYRILAQHKSYAEAEQEFTAHRARMWWHTFRAYKKKLKEYASLNGRVVSLLPGRQSERAVSAGSLRAYR